MGRRIWSPLIFVGGVAVACSGSSAGDGAHSDGGSVTTQSSSGGTSSSSGADSTSSSGSSSSGAASGSGGGASSGGGTSSGSVVLTGISVDAGSCLGGSALGALGKTHMIVGGSMQDATAAMAPFDLRYVYVSGGLFDGAAPCASCLSCTTNGGTKSCQTSNGGSGCSWWGCWQYDHDPPGEYVSGFASKCQKASPAQIPMITYYQLLQASGVAEGSAEVTSAATNQSFMTRYYADWRFLLKQIGQSVAILHIEPDFWGYAQQYAVTHGTTATAMPASVANANAADCSSLPNTIAGMGQCMVAMVRKFAPHALVGLHASAWSTNMDVAGNTSTTLSVSGEAAKTAAFLASCGESSADLVVVETSDRDADYYKSMGRNTWWDATNATLPDFHQDFAWVKALTESLSKPALYWQTPLGNASQNDTTNHWKDNRVQYFFSHMSELAAAHAIGVAYGAGDGAQTTPESDGGYFVSQAKAYYASAGGGQVLCQ